MNIIDVFITLGICSLTFVIVILGHIRKSKKTAALPSQSAASLHELISSRHDLLRNPLKFLNWNNIVLTEY